MLALPFVGTVVWFTEDGDVATVVLQEHPVRFCVSTLQRAHGPIVDVLAGSWLHDAPVTVWLRGTEIISAEAV